MTRQAPSEFRVRAGVVRRKRAGEPMIVDDEGREHAGLSPTGALLWQLLIDGASLDGLVEVLVTSAGVEAEAAEREVQQLLLWLSERNLIERVARG